jgi:hypothetical protein
MPLTCLAFLSLTHPPSCTCAPPGVHVSLSGRDAYDFLEKLVTLVLPSQNAFEGIMLKTLDRQHHVHFKVGWGKRK